MFQKVSETITILYKRALLYFIKDTFQKIVLYRNGNMPEKKRIFIYIFFFTLLFWTSSIFSDNLKEAKKAYSGRQFQKAVKLFQEYSRTNPGDGEPYMYLGYIYETLREYNISIAYFRKAVELKLNPKQKTTVLLKLIIYFNYLKAWNYVVHYCNQYNALEPGNQEVEKILSRARGNKGNDHVSSVYLAPQEREREKETKKSEKVPKENHKELKEPKEPKDFEQKIVLNKEKKELNTEEKILFQEVNKLFENGEFNKAEIKISKLIEISPQNKIYILKSGIIHTKLKEYSRAISEFESVSKNPSENEDSFNYQLFLNYGLAMANLEKYEPALENFKKSYFYGKSFLPLILVLRIKYENGDFEDTLRYANYITNLDNENLEALMYRAISKLQMGLKSEGYRDLLVFSKKIRGTYNNINEVPDKYNLGLHYLAVYYSGRKKYNLSNKYLTISQKTKLPSYTYTKGKNLFYLKSYVLSQQELEKLNEVPAANYILSKIYILANSSEKAKEYFTKAAQKREIYWTRAISDPIYKSYFQTNQEFSNFIITKGVIPKTQAIDEPKKNTN